MKKFLSKNVLTITGLLLGGVLGFLYWKFIGCASGTCPITSRWLNSTLYGAMMGGLLGNMFVKETSTEKTEK